MTESHGNSVAASPPGFPFSAVVGADDAKLALCLAAIDPRIGGVLLRGEKGSAKSTLARGMADLLPGTAPFIELPLGASEDRVVGSLDLTALLADQRARFRPGLLADADGGVLHVDEINLLPDHLVDVLLDVAVSGVNRVEREGITEVHPARFVLVGSMNPEEGELRPQLLDRFGLAVAVVAPGDPRDRADAVARRLSFDRDPELFAARWNSARSSLADRLQRARHAVAGAGTESLPGAADPDLVDAACEIAAAAGAEGLRADLVMCRAAAALAALEGRDRAGPADLRRVAPLVLSHRRRHPFGAAPPGDTIDDALDQALGPADSPELVETNGAPEPGPSNSSNSTDSTNSTGRQDQHQGDPPDDPGPTDSSPPQTADDGREASNRRRFDAYGAASEGVSEGFGAAGAGADVAAAVRLEAVRTAGDGPSGRRSVVEGPRGRVVRVRPPSTGDGGGPIAFTATAIAAAERLVGGAEDDRTGPGLSLIPGDVRESVREHRTANLIVLAVDTSGSMFALDRAEAVRGAVLALLVDAYQRRDRVALVAFRGERAEVVLRPTGSVEVARARLEGLPTGGRTPLAAGIDTALDLVLASTSTMSHRPLLVVVSDGRATATSPSDAGRDPVAAAMASAARVARHRIDAIVLDAEAGEHRLGLAADVAAAMGARHLPLTALTAATVERAVRSSLPVM